MRRRLAVLTGRKPWALAHALNEQWDKLKSGRAIEASSRPLAGSLREAFTRYKQIDSWSEKSLKTREEWERAWRWIGPVFGDVDPKTVTLEMVSRLRAHVRTVVSPREAHRVIKIWRALWRVAASMNYCNSSNDPSFGLRNVSAPDRDAKWSEGEAVRLAKSAWRLGFHGLCAAIAIAWDTQLSPVDVRGLTPSMRRRGATHMPSHFELARAKTGRNALGTLSRRTDRVLDEFLRTIPEIAPDAPLLRNRSGRPFSKDTLGDDFRDVRLSAFGPLEKRTLADFRRSGAVEAMAGGATPGQLANKMANDISTNNKLFKTYNPVDLATVREVDDARRKGRRKHREQGMPKTGTD